MTAETALAGRGGARRWRWNSLRLRILLAILAWIALGIGGIWFSATRLFAKHVEEQYHEELEVHIKELAGLVRAGPGERLHMDRPLSDPRYLVPLSGFYWQVSADGIAPMRSASMTRGSLDESVAHDSSIHHHVESGPTGPAITYGFVRRVAGVGEVHYVIATDERLLDETIASFTRELSAWLAALVAGLLLTGLAVVRFGLRPLDRLAEAGARLRSGAAETLEGDYPIEFAPLVADLNAFIAHNRKVVERARVEAGNLAHALRTPLAVIIDEAERLSAGATTAESGGVLLDQGQAMAQQIEYQLARARSAVGARGPGTVSRLSEVIPPVVSAMQRLHPDRTFAVEGLEADGPAMPIDPVDLSELVSILLDNAGKWARREVTLIVSNTAEGPALGVLDDGPGMTAEQARRACEVGTRFDPDKPGSGLGLAIAREIAEAYGLCVVIGGRRDGVSGVAVDLKPG